MRKVKLEVLKPWITTRFTELNGFEDDIVSSMIIGLLEEKDNLVRLVHCDFMQLLTGQWRRPQTHGKSRSKFKGS